MACIGLHVHRTQLSLATPHLQDDASLRSYFDGWQRNFSQSFQQGSADYDQRLGVFRDNLLVGSSPAHDCVWSAQLWNLTTPR